MKRTQLYLHEDDCLTIQALASQNEVSQAEIIRQAIKDGLKALKIKNVKKSALVSLEEFSLMGKKGPKDLGSNMNDYLYGKKSDYATR